MNLDNFQKYIDPTILKRGEKIFKDDKILDVKLENDTLAAVIFGNNDIYTTGLKFDGDLEIINYGCTCPYVYSYNKCCKHIAALMIYAQKKYRPISSNGSSRSTAALITEFGKLAESFAFADDAEEQVKIVPELTLDRSGIKYTLKIGKNRMYTVQNIFDLMGRFLNGEKYSYGKGLTLIHDLNALDERSYELLNISYSIANSSDRYYSSIKKEFPLKRNYIDSFFELYKDDYVSYEGTPCLVKFENPEINLKIRKVKNNRYSLNVVSDSSLVGLGRKGCFFDYNNHIFRIADTAFSKTIYNLFRALEKGNSLYISEEDMQAFYNAVLKPLNRFVNIYGMDKLTDYIPPEAVCRLYIDSTEEGSVQAKAEYSYGDKIYPAFYERHTNPFCDYEAESIAEKTMLKYFSRNTNDDTHPLIIEKESEVYRFMSEGIPELAKIMEIYTADRFNKLSVRPPAKAVVGIRPGSGNLLELEITADGYSVEELISLLGAYRKGKKYHRLKDGSFASIDSSIEELAEITQSLNITDKSLLKEKINIPRYRMLYLDSLNHECESVRIDRSREFKKIIKSFRSSVDDTELLSVPEKLDGTMREYQKYGYRWMQTIANYGFGGILADDMGLGKTIQAIALISEYKISSAEHKPCLVICPSSLILNWENEIRKFAPELKSLMVTGVASARSELLNHLNEYDIIITSYSLIIRDIAGYEEVGFHYEFIDEAQYIKNHSTQMSKAVKGIKADVRFALTGTPVENSLAELWSIFDFIMPGYLFNYNHFKKNYENPIVVKKEEQQVKALQKIVSPFILRRLKKEVLSELPDKTETILRSDMNEEQSKLYSANVAEMKLMLQDGLNDNSDRFRILAMITRLRQICCDPTLAYDNFDGKSAKLEQCIELISNCVNSGHKILLFSQFTSMLDIIAKELSELNISYYMLTGKTSPKKRINLVNCFNEDDTNVFLISLKAGGTGLNLTGADIVIHYDPWWNVSAENQASDRAYRIGQKRNVQIYKLIANKSIEEKIIKLQESKSELFDIAVSGDGDIMHMNAEDILGLLE